MVGGQARISPPKPPKRRLTLQQITALQAGKTGALIAWSALVGRGWPRPSVSLCDAMAPIWALRFRLPMTFWMSTGDAATVGKAVGKDAAAGKATFVS